MRIKLIFQIVLLLALPSVGEASRVLSGWPDWDEFAARFVEVDGRVVDVTFERKSTSEGQSYGLFFALVANQREQFDSILTWTSDYLAGRQLGNKLPAWLWGLKENGKWGVKDENPASDADLWIAYTLFEAARLWHVPSYAETARKLLTQISRDEITEAGNIGPVLLPGPIGFALDKGRFRLNPSYLPDFMFRYFAAVDPKGPWQAVWNGYMRLIPQIFAAGVAPDLFIVDSNGMVMPDSEGQPTGSYDAIRVYLWAGMSGGSSQEILKRLAPYAGLIRKYGSPPEKVNTLTGLATKSDFSPRGFSAAVLPFLSAIGDTATLDKQLARLAIKPRGPTNYYDQSLLLFGKGWLDGQYHFDDQGRLHPKWSR